MSFRLLQRETNIFFSTAHEAFIKISQVLDYKVNFDKFIKIELIQTLFPDPGARKV